MNIFTHPRFRAGWILILISTLSSIGWSLVRWAYENGQTYAQITVDYDDTKSFADAVQEPHKLLLKQLKMRGVTSVAIYQQTVSSLRDNGRVVVLTREEAQAQYPKVNWPSYLPAYRYVILSGPSQQALMQQIYRHLQEQSQPSLPPQWVPMPEATHAIFIPASRQLLSDAQVGFDPAQLKILNDMQLRVTARLSNTLNLTLDRFRQRLDEAKQAGARVVIFSEDEVVGYSSLIPMVSRELKQRQMLFGAIEFSKQRGLEEMMSRSDGMMVRVHSVAGEEAAKAKRDVLLERYVRAIKERNIRVAYVRMARQLKGEWELENTGEAVSSRSTPERRATALDQNLELIADIAKELRQPPFPALKFLRPGFTLADAHGFRDYPKSFLAEQGLHPGAIALSLYLMRFFAGLGGVGAAWLMLNLFFDISRHQSVNLLAFGLACCAGLSVSSGMGALLLALLVGVLMTPVALLWGGLPLAWDAWRHQGKFPPEIFAGQIKASTVFPLACGVLVRTSLLTLCGGFMTVALMNKWTYMSKADEYFGEKATLLAPLIIMGLALTGKYFPHRVIVEGAAPSREQARKTFSGLLNNPFTVRHLMIGLIVIVGGLIWIARTGNDSGMDISPLELKMRAFMEQVFITRPRTKEVFLGHPAVFLAVYLGMKRRWPLFLGAMLAATIGQADLYNTMCHIHTPLFYSLLRSIHAIWLGILLGGGAIWLWDFIENRLRRRQSGSSNGRPVPAFRRIGPPAAHEEPLEEPSAAR